MLFTNYSGKPIGIGSHSYNSPKEVIIDGQQWLTSFYTGSFESTAESHLNSIKELTTLDEYKNFILTKVNERLTNDYFDITLLGSEGWLYPAEAIMPGTPMLYR